jgi:hypothetical protein
MIKNIDPISLWKLVLPEVYFFSEFELSDDLNSKGNKLLADLKRRIIKAIVKWFKRTLGLTTRVGYTLVALILLMLPVLIWLAYDSLFGLNQEIAPDNYVAGE